ncbi:MAG: hypothetical protein JSR70_05430 [Proteobacteria bacterium]|nr:hypothetical protein [Pseudomonadota bacterium]
MAVKLQRRTVRHLGWALAAKLVLLALLYGMFFAPAHRPAIDADAEALRMHIPLPPR